MTWQSCTAGNSYSCKKKIQKRVFACGEAASQTEVPVRRSRAGTESDHNYANTTSFKGGSNFLRQRLLLQLYYTTGQYPVQLYVLLVLLE